MILQKSEHDIQRSNLTGEKKYGIALNAKIYSILSDKLYSDRIGSTVREVCSNAWDAHVMGGTPTLPFHVTLPTDLEPHFIVEDFGPGMPDEQAQELYSTLGLSTKEGSNDQIGAFGLGSKSPYTVTDTFHVENTYQGITHYYMCFKSEDGFPSILKTGQVDNPDKFGGVKVVIPASWTKYSEYKNSLVKQLLVMEPKPVLTNNSEFYFKEAVRELESEFGFVIKDALDFHLKNRSLYAKMGMVLYPIDLGQINLKGVSSFYQNIKHTSTTVLNFDIGDLDPLPSREGLTYDTKSIELIEARYQEFINEVSIKLIDSVKSCDLPLDAYNNVVSIKLNFGIDLLSKITINDYLICSHSLDRIFPEFTYDFETEAISNSYVNGVKVSTTIKKIVPSSAYRYVYEDYHSYSKTISKDKPYSFKGTSFDQLNKIVDGSVKFVLMDEENPKHKRARMMSIIKSLEYNNRVYFISINSYYDKVDDYTDFIETFNKIHPDIMYSCIKFSDIKKPEIVKVAGDDNKNNKMEGVNIKRKLSPSDKQFYKNDDIDVDNICYVTSDRNNLIKYKGKTVSNIMNLASNIGMDVVIVRKGGLHNIEELENMEIFEFSDVINSYFLDYKFSEDFKRLDSANTIYNENYSSWFNYGTIQGMQSLISYMESCEYPIPEFIKLYDSILKIKNNSVNLKTGTEIIKYQSIKSSCFFEYVKDQDWCKIINVDISKDFDNLLTIFNLEYPAFEYMVVKKPINYSRDEESSIRRFSYIKMVDELKECRQLISTL